MLSEVADGVWVRQSAWVWSNSTVVRGDAGLVLVDPGIDGAELDALADDVAALGIPVIAGFSTHAHWDHLLWHPRFGDVPRYATEATAAMLASDQVRERGRGMAADSAEGIPLELLGIVSAVPADGGGVPGTIMHNPAHATGHAALLLADRGVLLAGDMLSDELVPMPDPRDPDGLSNYLAALAILEDAVRTVGVVVPGHGSAARGDEISARISTDRAYVQAVQRGEQPDDERWGPRG